MRKKSIVRFFSFQLLFSLCLFLSLLLFPVVRFEKEEKPRKHQLLSSLNLCSFVQLCVPASCSLFELIGLFMQISQHLLLTFIILKLILLLLVCFSVPCLCCLELICFRFCLHLQLPCLISLHLIVRCTSTLYV